ncbi:hypothetical protein [Yinghuangia seranimata]|uniref:hypothetical protein n=1 Tax=Yinghuangia seranimata TaxID=408067 RepID=UPI00248C8C54|nr:hypothetical protein [Yinghuangia seranimata]MDI2131818.1 hypothetical protein [Yinghuangia seranimata]
MEGSTRATTTRQPLHQIVYRWQRQDLFGRKGLGPAATSLPVADLARLGPDLADSVAAEFGGDGAPLTSTSLVHVDAYAAVVHRVAAEFEQGRLGNNAHVLLGTRAALTPHAVLALDGWSWRAGQPALGEIPVGRRLARVPAKILDDALTERAFALRDAAREQGDALAVVLAAVLRRPTMGFSLRTADTGGDPVGLLWGLFDLITVPLPGPLTFSTYETADDTGRPRFVVVPRWPSRLWSGRHRIDPDAEARTDVFRVAADLMVRRYADSDWDTMYPLLTGLQSVRGMPPYDRAVEIRDRFAAASGTTAGWSGGIATDAALAAEAVDRVHEAVESGFDTTPDEPADDDGPVDPLERTARLRAAGLVRAPEPLRVGPTAFDDLEWDEAEAEAYAERGGGRGDESSTFAFFDKRVGDDEGGAVGPEPEPGPGPGRGPEPGRGPGDGAASGDETGPDGGRGPLPRQDGARDADVGRGVEPAPESDLTEATGLHTAAVPAFDDDALSGEPEAFPRRSAPAAQTVGAALPDRPDAPPPSAGTAEHERWKHRGVYDEDIDALKFAADQVADGGAERAVAFVEDIVALAAALELADIRLMPYVVEHLPRRLDDAPRWSQRERHAVRHTLLYPVRYGDRLVEAGVDPQAVRHLFERVVRVVLTLEKDPAKPLRILAQDMVSDRRRLAPYPVLDDVLRHSAWDEVYYQEIGRRWLELNPFAEGEPAAEG